LNVRDGEVEVVQDHGEPSAGPVPSSGRQVPARLLSYAFGGAP